MFRSPMLSALACIASISAYAATPPIGTSMLDGGSTHVFFHDDGVVAQLKRHMSARVYAQAQHIGDDEGIQSDIKHEKDLWYGTAVLGSGPKVQALVIATDGKKVWALLRSDALETTMYGDPNANIAAFIRSKDPELR